jgi:hypothetical protein
MVLNQKNWEIIFILKLIYGQNKETEGEKYFQHK